jgi:tungstate transport system ATP-binding protein
VSAPTILPLRLEAVAFEAGGRLLIEPVSLDIAHGPRSLLLGPNGSGKSLFLRLCHGLIRPSRGRVIWQGEGANSGGRSLLQRQAMVFQRPVMLRRSALANVEYALKLRGMHRKARHDRAREMLARTGLGALARMPARALSGGEQQRLALARAWAIEPEILFLDEPTANLDPAAVRMVEEIIGAIHAAGTKIVMTTHDLAQARRLADEIIFLHRGRVVERREADSFFLRPETEAARAFVEGRLHW